MNVLELVASAADFFVHFGSLLSVIAMIACDDENQSPRIGAVGYEISINVTIVASHKWATNIAG